MPTLETRAAKLFPDNTTLQRKWVSAVTYLRNGRGWILDKKVSRCQPTR